MRTLVKSGPAQPGMQKSAADRGRVILDRLGRPTSPELAADDRLLAAMRDILTVASFPDFTEDPDRALGSIKDIAHRVLESICSAETTEKD